jgi:probable dihydroxyacetone kinase regulator
MSEGNRTKYLIKEALINLCKQQSFHKISVQQIAQKAEVNRQTFYYHFSDKYDLLRWIYKEDALRFLDSRLISLDNWEEQALKMLKAIAANKEFYQNTVEADPEVLQQEFTKMIQLSFIKLFEQMDEEKQLSKTDKLFYARFFSYGCSGVLTHWISEGYKETPMEIAMQLFRLAKDTELYSYRLYEKEE